MTDTQPQRNVPTWGVLLIGSISLVVGAVVWFVFGALGSPWAMLGVALVLIGLPVLIVGLVRESQDAKRRRSTQA